MTAYFLSILRVCSAPVVAASLLAGCAIPGPAEVAVLPQAPAAFKESDERWVAAPPAESQPRGQWWRAFKDPVLDGLIEASLSGNTGIQAAAARVTKARAIAGIAESGRRPQLGLTAGYGQQGGPLINAVGASGTLWTVSAGLSYETDLFGRLDGEVQASVMEVEAKEALLRSVTLVAHADIAQTYFALRGLDVERILLRETLRAHRDTVLLAQRRLDLGTVAELDVVRLRADAASIEAELRSLDRRRAELEHALALLVGEVASTFDVKEQVWTESPPFVPAGIPSTVLTRRADVAAAQRSMLAAQARVGVARTAWFPSVSLTTAQGFASTDLRDLLSMSVRAWSLGALLSLPLLDGGRREAAVKGASADWEVAVASYREHILVAFKDVEDQLSGLRLLGDQARAQDEAVTAAERVQVLAKSRYESGLASQLEVLDAERGALRLRRQALQVRAARYQTTVGLVRALGGGWDSVAATGQVTDGHRSVSTR